MKPTCMILVGSQCSGKSTYIKSLPDIYEVISSDTIMLGLFPHRTYDQIGFLESQKDVTSIKREKTILAIKERKSFVVDNMNLTLKARNLTLCRFSKKDKEIYHIICVVMPRLSLDILVERNYERSIRYNKTIDIHTISECYDQYIEPTLEEGFDEIVFL